MTPLGITILALLVLDGAARLFLAIRVVMRHCPMTVSLAWILVLFFLPFISIFLYAIVGENRLGQRRARQFEALTSRIEDQAVAHWSRQHQTATAHDKAFQHLAKLATRVGGLPALRGNAVELLGEATRVLDRLIADIDAAKSHCHLLYYIWMPKSRGLEVAEALIRAASRGVTCRVLIDGGGGRAFFKSELPERLRAGGVTVVEALPVSAFRMLLVRLDLRNHRKIAVIDGTTAYCGSQNLTDETFRSHKHRRRSLPWIDATVRIQGPAVQALQTVFLRDWLLDSEEQLPPVETFFPDTSRPGPSVVHVIASGPGPQPDAIHQAFLAMLYAAREEIIMTTPYFVPDEATKGALVNAALRGVMVTIVLPDRLDAAVVAAASRSHYDDLLAAGVRIFHHEGGLLHAKTATIDRSLAVVGSANFDMRSFWLNFEVTLFVYDDDFAGVTRLMQTGYLTESEEVFLDQWRARPVFRRFVDNCAQLLGPLL